MRRKDTREESPGSIGSGCRLITGEGDFKDSATEINRQDRDVLVRVERRGKSSPAAWRQGALCKPHPEQHRGETEGLTRPSQEVA